MKKTSKLLITFLALFLISTLTMFTTTVSAQERVVVSLLNQDPDPGLAGDIIELRFQVENRGSVATKNYVLEIKPEYPFESISGEPLMKEIGILNANLAGDNSKIIKFKVRLSKDATAGSYNLPLLSYEEGNQANDQQRLFSIDIDTRENAEVIYIDQIELTPGKITPMSFTINNVGSAPLRDLTFEWENEDDIILPVGSANTKYIKYIDVGESAKLEFNVLASTNADPDLYKLDLQLTYEDPLTGNLKEIITKAGVYVGGSTDFDVAYSGSSGGEYSFAISNIGSVSASSVTVKIPQQNGWRVSGSNAVIIGNLNEGDYTIASFTMTSTSNSGFAGRSTGTQDTTTTQRPTQGSQSANQETNLNVEIVYTDSRGNRDTIVKEVAVTPSQSFTNADGTATTNAGGFQGRRQQQQSPIVQIWNQGKWIFIGVGSVILLFVLQKKYKKGKMKDPNYTYKKMLKGFFKKKRK